VLVILAVLVFVFGMIFSRNFRRDFLQRVVAAGMTLVFMILFVVLLMQRAEIASSDAGAEPYAVDAPASAAAPPEEGDSSRGVALALALLSTAAVLTGAAWIVTRLLGRKQRRRRPSPDVLEEIAEVARTASRRLHDGDPLSRVVLDCYQEMSLLLAREENTPFDDYLTPREFSQRLRSRGMDSAHAQRLTQIFEMVRYGGRSDPRLAAEAMECLTSVRDRYAAASP
jgi:hypothetical protein